MYDFSSVLMMGLSLLGPHSVHSSAVQIPVLTIESDATPEATLVSVGMDSSGNMTSLTSTASTGNVVTFSLEQLRQAPRVFKTMSGRDVVYFNIESDFNPRSGGHANLRFLQNGISGTYKNFRIHVIAQGQGISLVSEPNPRDPESDENRSTSGFNYLYMNKNTIWGRVIGIESVIPQQR